MKKLVTVATLLLAFGIAVPSLWAQEAQSLPKNQFMQAKKTAPKGRIEKDVPAEMVRARQALETAKNELAHAGDEWGGHRVTAMAHIDQALQEIKASEDYYRKNKNKL